MLISKSTNLVRSNTTKVSDQTGIKIMLYLASSIREFVVTEAHFILQVYFKTCILYSPARKLFGKFDKKVQRSTQRFKAQ
jgi:hypothetical protein